MKGKGVICLFVFVIALINALTIVAIGSSETLTGDTNYSGHEKAFDPGIMNLSIKPGDDFYEYVDGAWIKNHPVPPDKSRYGESEILTDRNYDSIKIIIENAANNTSAPEGSLEKKISKFYSVGMDNATIEKQRLDPIRDELNMIDNISNTSDIQTVSTQMMEYGMNPFFSMYAAPDKKNSKIMIATLTQGGLGLPDKDSQDRDFYLRQDYESINAKKQYLTHVTKMFIFLGDNPKVAEDNARTVMRIETRLANASFNNVDNNDEIKTYNMMSIEELQAFAPGMNWSLLLSVLGRPDVTEINVRNPSFFKELSTALQDESIADWKTFLRWKLILAASPYLSSNVEEEHLNFYGRELNFLHGKLILATSPYLNSDLEEEHLNFYERELNGQQEMNPRWKRVINAENKAMGEAIGHIYVDKYFDPDSKSRMQEMVFNLKKAFRERIQNLTWMDPETKQKALMKLEVLEVQVGYPDEWLNYSELEVKNDSYVNNTIRASEFYFHHGPVGLDRIGKPVNKKLWEVNPQIVNAYADYNKIIIVFPAGILQPPFFNKEADDAVNYGAIGAVIGHEMTHHFDSQGRKFDASGNLTDWWTPKDADSFNKNTETLVGEYNRFEVLPGLHVNGNLTLPENVADFGGVTIAYHAYKKSSKGEPEMIDGFTGDQRFFLSFTQIWRESHTNEHLRIQTLTDTHSPTKFRVNGVVFNVPEFYKAFPNVKPGDKLYRPENERPVIW